MDYKEADRRYHEIKQRHEAGALTDEEFDEQLKDLMVQDEEGRWWVKSRRTGEWHYYDGTTWVKDTPPGYEPPQVAPQAPSPPQGGPSTTPAQAPTWTRPLLWSVLAPVAVIVFVLIVVAITNNARDGGGYAAGGGGSATATSGPTATSSPTPTGSDLPFSDDFSDVSSGWDNTRESTSVAYYDNGGYRMYQEKQDYATNAIIQEAGTHQDVAVEVDARVIGGQPEDTHMGVICRARDSDNYHLLGVYQDGYAYISKAKNNEINNLTGGWHRDAIGGNLATPHIRGECVGSKLTLYVNGQKVEETEDSEYQSGEVGLVVGNHAKEPPTTDVLFDNFLVSAP